MNKLKPLGILLLALFAFVLFTAWGIYNLPDADNQTEEITVDGKLEGHVLFKVEPPEPEKLKVSKDPQVCGSYKLSEEFIVSKSNQGLKNVVIRIDGIPDDEYFDDEEEVKKAVLEQKECVYVPHVQAVMVNSKVSFVNNDPMLHNIHTYFVFNEFKKKTLFNYGQVSGRNLSITVGKAQKKIGITDKSGVWDVRCDVHNWMNAYIVVHDNPFFAVTDENGFYAISDIPPGTYTVKVWHEGLGEFDKPITIKAGETTKLDFPIEGN